jgi:hypothetical protein
MIGRIKRMSMTQIIDVYRVLLYERRIGTDGPAHERMKTLVAEKERKRWSSQSR